MDCLFFDLFLVYSYLPILHLLPSLFELLKPHLLPLLDFCLQLFIHDEIVLLQGLAREGVSFITHEAPLDVYSVIDVL